MKALGVLRSFRLRVALLSSIGTVAVLALFSAFVHEWLRRSGLRDIDARIESNVRLVLAQPRRPIIWHEVDRRLAEQEPGSVIFVWMSGVRLSYISPHWPSGVDPLRIAAGTSIPANWRDSLLEVASDPGPPPGGARNPHPGRPGGAVVELDGMPDAQRVPGLSRSSGDPSRRYATFTDGEAVFVLAMPTLPVERSLARFRTAAGAALAPAFVLAFFAGFVVAGRSLRSVNRLADAVERVTIAGLDQRVDPTEAEREFGRLVVAFNDMLRRLERSFLESRRFTDNAAHEMRTPLTILQGKLAEAIRVAYPGSPQQQLFTDLLEEVARLKGIVDRLLLLARSDAGRLDLYKERVDLTALLENLAEDCTVLAPQLTYKMELARGIELPCDRALMSQVVHNLLSNAIKYNTRENGFVRMEMAAAGDEIVLRVANSGRPIKPEDAGRVFERFYRADQSHSRAIEGTGLGLSVAREIARAHGGDLVVEHSNERETSFVLRMPLRGDSSASRPALVPTA